MPLFSWLRKQMTGRSRTRRTPARKPAVGFRPRLETLEGRIVPSFSSPVVLPSSQPVALIAGDVNGDGRPDLISADNNGHSINVRLGDGKGGFVGLASPYGLQWQAIGPATALAVGTFQGQPSIFVASSTAGNGYGGGTSYLSVLQLKSGVLTQVTNITYIQRTNATPISSLAVADLYGDGETDVVAAPATGGHMSVERSINGMAFGAPQSYLIPLSLPPLSHVQLAVGDVNGDGKPDVVVTNPLQSSVSVLLNNGNGTFGAAQNYAVGGVPTAVAVGDVNGDGRPDIVTANSNGTVSVLSGQGNGTFGLAQNYAIGGPANSVALGDFNHDGKLDIVTTGGTEMDVLLNNGSGAFAAYQKVGPGGSSVVAADFNGDGYADLAEIVASNSMEVLLNDAKW